jgi:asparagine synthase (glutamine-hydrolysing)
MFLLSRLVRERGLEVVLTGEGSDEVFLGYEIFKETVLRRQWSVLAEPERHEGLSRLYAYQRHFRPETYRALAAVFGEHSHQADDEFFSHRLRFSNATLAARLIRTTADGVTRLREWTGRDREGFKALGPVAKAQWLEFTTLLAGYLLSTQGDRMAFAHGVENRCPFLDPDVVAWANSLPIEMRLPDLHNEKFILKEAFRDALPPHVVDKPKRPYLAPDAAAFVGPNRADYIEDALSEAAIAELGIVDETLSRRLARKVLSSAPADVSPRESQAFIQLLSLVLLNHAFVRRSYDRPRLPQAPVRTCDRRDPRV